jgi:general stress protein 26
MPSITDPLIQQLLNGRYIASLATQNPNGAIHQVAVWYLFIPGDGSASSPRIYIATSTRTRKARNIQSNPNVSLMIDSRDPAASLGVNITGSAQFLTGDASRQWNHRVHAKYMSPAALADPQVGPTFSAMDDVTVEITPGSLITWDMRTFDAQVFHSSFAQNPSYLLPTLH